MNVVRESRKCKEYSRGACMQVQPYLASREVQEEEADQAEDMTCTRPLLSNFPSMLANVV